MIVATADVGGTRTTVAVTRDGDVLEQVRGPGAAVRPGRGLSSAATVADLVRSALARANLLRADVVVVGAAGAGREADAAEVRGMLARERLASRVIVVSDVALAFEALGLDVGVVLVGGTGSIAFGRAPDGRQVRRGGFGWQMGDEGGGYWIGRQALAAVGRAEDGIGPPTRLRETLMKAVGATTFRDVVGWSTVASPREVASLARVATKAVEDGDAVARGIFDEAVRLLALLVNDLAREFPTPSAIPVGLAGGLIGEDGPLAAGVRAAIAAPFVPLDAAVNPLLGGPRLAGRPAG